MPGERRGGRRAGTPNRLTATLRQAIEAAFDEVGGQAYLVGMAKKEPKAFMALLGKLLPRDIQVTEPKPKEAPLDVLDAARRIAYLFAMAEREKSKEERQKH